MLKILRGPVSVGLTTAVVTFLADLQAGNVKISVAKMIAKCLIFNVLCFLKRKKIRVIRVRTLQIRKIR